MKTKRLLMIFASVFLALFLFYACKKDTFVERVGVCPPVDGQYALVLSSNPIAGGTTTGAGYDILLSDKVKGNNYKQAILSPFIDFHPYFGQNPRSIETWNVTTLRFGAVLKFGQNRAIKPIAVRPTVVESTPPVVVVVPVIITPEPVIILPNVVDAYTLFFKFDESNLDVQSISNLNNLVRDLSKDSEIGVQIKSYADIRGTDVYNINLSIRRSEAVVHYLLSKGIAASRINSKGLGETIVFNKDKNSKINEANYASNRRSNLIVVAIVSK